MGQELLTHLALAGNAGLNGSDGALDDDLQLGQRGLVKNGANVNIQTSTDGGWTPLMEACSSGNGAIVEFLLEHGANASLWNSYEGGTARDIAAKRGQVEIVALIDCWRPVS
jgi:hypothetical protein